MDLLEKMGASVCHLTALFVDGKTGGFKKWNHLLQTTDEFKSVRKMPWQK